MMCMLVQASCSHLRSREPLSRKAPVARSAVRGSVPVQAARLLVARSLAAVLRVRLLSAQLLEAVLRGCAPRSTSQASMQTGSSPPRAWLGVWKVKWLLITSRQLRALRSSDHKLARLLATVQRRPSRRIMDRVASAPVCPCCALCRRRRDMNHPRRSALRVRHALSQLQTTSSSQRRCTSGRQFDC